MATDASFADYVVDQLKGAGGVTSRKMFGEYAIYRRGKVVALACDNQLFVRPTDAGLTVLGGAAMHGAPYPGAKPHFLVSDLLEDRDLLVRLIEATDAALPARKKKARRKKGAKKTKGAAKQGAGTKAKATRTVAGTTAPKKTVPRKTAPKKTSRARRP